MAVNALVKKIGNAGQNVWERLPEGSRQRPPLRVVGRLIHNLSGRFSERRQSTSTWFLRNQPLLTTIQELVGGSSNSSEPLRLCSIGCSTGAEIYSVLWILRKYRRDLRIVPVGVDRSAPAIEKAKAGRYVWGDSELRNMNRESLPDELFDVHGDEVKIKDWIAEGVEWLVADAGGAELRARIGLQDVLLANNFLIHMNKAEATSCFASVVKLTKPGGLFVCRGVDLDIREKIVRKFGLTPIATRIEEIHNADPDLDARMDWPWKYWALEPLDKKRKRWVERYATIFRVPSLI